MPNGVPLTAIGQEFVKGRVTDEAGVVAECGRLGVGKVIVDLQVRVRNLLELFPQVQAELSQTAIGIFQLFHFQKDGFRGVVHL